MSEKVEIDWRSTFIEALDAPGALGNTYCRFYNYSYLNQIRLLLQGVSEPVATYKRWTELGFHVRRGTHAKSVLAPILVNKEQADANGDTKLDANGKPIKRQFLVGFRASNTVFGFSDTDGDELPAVSVPGWDADRALESLGVVRDRFVTTRSNAQGYSEWDGTTHHLAINPVAHYPVRTLLHELAHIALGHCKTDIDDPESAHRGVREFEAESTAYVLAKELELADWDASESRGYIDRWLGGKSSEQVEDLDRHMSRVFSAVNKILVAGRESTEKVA